MPKFEDKLRVLNDSLRKAVKESGLPIRTVGLIFNWDRNQVEISEDTPVGTVVTVPDELTLKDMLQVQSNAASFMVSITTSALESVMKPQAEKSEKAG